MHHLKSPKILITILCMAVSCSPKHKNILTVKEGYFVSCFQKQEKDTLFSESGYVNLGNYFVTGKDTFTIESAKTYLEIFLTNYNRNRLTKRIVKSTLYKFCIDSMSKADYGEDIEKWYINKDSSFAYIINKITMSFIILDNKYVRAAYYYDTHDGLPRKIYKPPYYLYYKVFKQEIISDSMVQALRLKPSERLKVLWRG